MIVAKSLDEIYFSIRDKVIEKLENSQQLKEIQTIVYGERQKIGVLKTPAIWIIPNSYQPDLQGGHRVQHDIPFDFVVLIKSNNPEEGLSKAQELSFKIYDTLMKDRTLDNLVSDVRPTRVDPAYEEGGQAQLYWSAVQFVFRLQRRE